MEQETNKGKPDDSDDLWGVSFRLHCNTTYWVILRKSIFSKNPTGTKGKRATYFQILMHNIITIIMILIKISKWCEQGHLHHHHLWIFLMTDFKWRYISTTIFMASLKEEAPMGRLMNSCFESLLCEMLVHATMSYFQQLLQCVV